VCGLLSELGVGAVALVGDSLAYLQFQSLWYLLRGTEDRDGWGEVPSWRQDSARPMSALLRCPSRKTGETREPWNVTVEYIRNDYLSPTESGFCEACRCNKLTCKPWLPRLLAAADRTRVLLVLNTDAHLASVREFRSHLARALRALTLEGLPFQTPGGSARPGNEVGAFLQGQPNGNLVVLRTTPAGHPGCRDFSVPFANAEEARARASPDFGEGPRHHWNIHGLFDKALKEMVYGSLAASSLPNNGTAKTGVGDLMQPYRRADTSALRRVRAHGGVVVLDVGPMTLLRGYGHRGDKGDCLHYYLPGVVDHWNHLLFTTLSST